MKSLTACQNEASRGLSSASRLTALSSSSSAARCAARFVPTGVRKSRILSSAVGSLFASNSDDRARDRKASMHVSRRVLMTMLNAHTPLGVHYTALVKTARWKRGIIPPFHEWPPTGGSNGKLYRTTKILSHARRRGSRLAARGPRAAGGDAGGWVPPPLIARAFPRACIPPGVKRRGLYRGR